MDKKVALITGGTSGIGEATAERFAQEGIDVVFAGRNVEKGNSIVANLKDKGHEVEFYKADVSNYDEIRSMFDYVVDKYKRLDIVVAAAGIAIAETEDTTVEEWSKLIDVNLNAVYETNRLAIKQMLKQEDGGSIINLGSVHSFVATPASSSYSASKGGIKMMTQALGARYAKDKIRINSVNPGYIETNMTKNLDQEALKRLHPIGRLGKSEEVASLINFLAGDESKFIIGASFVIDGGYSII